jgi:hypothetical protein
MEFKENEYKLNKLKENFQNIESIIQKINISKINILEKIDKYKVLYQDLLKNNNDDIFIFCLDSLYFQYKTSLMEYEFIEKNIYFIMNRIYCDYYKLYNIIILELNEKKIIDIKKKIFPKYKDLDILYQYSWETILSIHNEILSIIDKLYLKYKEIKSQISNYIDNNKSVISISNFINTLKYENEILENVIKLYISYISFFHYSQNKILVRMNSKMFEFEKYIDEYSNKNDFFSIDDVDDVEDVKIISSERERENIREINNILETPVKEDISLNILENHIDYTLFEKKIDTIDIFENELLNFEPVKENNNDICLILNEFNIE